LRYERVAIASIGWELGDEVVTSAAIEDRLAPVYERLGLVPGRLELMTGIRERRFFAAGVRPSDIAIRAGRKALERCGFDRARIGCLIHASVCRDFLEPATANVVHHALELPSRAQVFDLSNACLGVMNGVLVAANMIELGQIDAALVVAGENGRPLLDATIGSLLADETLTRKSIKSAVASLTIGSGGTAVVVAQKDLAGGHRIRGAAVRSATEHHRLCVGGAIEANDTGVTSETGLGMSTDAEDLLAAGIALARSTWADFRSSLDFVPDRFVTHQVGRAHHHALSEALELDPEQGYITFDRLGNVGSVSLPISFGMALESGFVRGSDRVALLGIGSGLSCLMMGVSS
jgi:3-oxoacyl-[acyl-carrier-protein] synthase-3